MTKIILLIDTFDLCFIFSDIDLHSSLKTDKKIETLCKNKIHHYIFLEENLLFGEKTNEVSSQIFGFISCFLGNRRLRVPAIENKCSKPSPLFKFSVSTL